MSKGLEKYLRDAEQQCALELNYFDDTTSLQSEEPILEDAEQISEYNPATAKQTSMEDTDAVTNIPESPKQDTGHTLRHLSQVCADADESVNKA